MAKGSSLRQKETIKTGILEHSGEEKTMKRVKIGVQTVYFSSLALSKSCSMMKWNYHTVLCDSQCL